jgi:hypothetical protein
MTGHRLSIFREEAYRRYLQGREKTVLPRFISPPTFIYFWLAAGFLLIGAAVAWSARVPVYATGHAVVATRNADARQDFGEIVVVAFLPAETFSQLEVGQTLYLQPHDEDQRIERRIEAVELSEGGTVAAIKESGVNYGDGQRTARPAAVAIAQFQPAQGGRPDSAQIGAVYRAEVEVGSRRVISFLPVIGSLFESR